MGAKANRSRHGGNSQSKMVSLSEVTQNRDLTQRISTTINEFDRVLGGTESLGMVPGEVILLGGEPGIGKSTILTQMVLGLITKSTQKQGKIKPILYVAGEESPHQIALRINRLKSAPSITDAQKSTKETLTESLLFATTTDVDELLTLIEKSEPQLLMVDSVQTLTTQDLTGAAGSIGQVKEVTTRLVALAKRLHLPTFLVGHVTKEGRLAGPMLLEHIVDAVLELSGDRSLELRLLRAVKNRFGATDEVGVFRMTESGYQEIANPSQFFLETRQAEQAGSVITCVMEGTRPLLIEVQALTVKTYLAQPRRVGRGIPINRLQILTAVLEKHCQIPTAHYDVFVSIAGGYETKEAVLDLAICVALASSIKGIPLPEGTVFLGEVGLLGEIRAAPLLERRLKEAKRLGFSKTYSRQTHRALRALLSELKIVSA